MKEEVHITTERIDDFVVLVALIQQMDLPSILDWQIARHWCQQGLSWDWVASIQITTVTRNEETIAQFVSSLGWRAYASNAP